jgi:hypothetical protein
MLDAVLKVVPADTMPDVLAKSDDKASPETPAAPSDGEADPAAPDEDDNEPLPDNASPLLKKKISKLLKDRHELREQVRQYESMRPSAEIGHQLQSFAKEHDLSADDVGTVMQIAALLRHGDYEAFYRVISPYVRTAQEYLGVTLPNDLRERVQQGHMTEQAAREFARVRMDKQRVEQTRETEQAQFATQSLASTQDQVTRSVSAYEQRLAAADPDYKAKAASVRRMAQAMLFEKGGTITSVDEALAITKAAYDEVNATIRRQQPAPRATGHIPNGNGSTRSAQPEPKSMMEAALQGLSKYRNGRASP